VRLRHICQLEHIRAAVAAIDQRFHCARRAAVGCILIALKRIMPF
jgi:hypothetical protein